MGTNPSGFEGANLPIENVSWYDAIEYCNKRSEREGLKPAYTIDKSRFDPNNENATEDDNIRWFVTWNKNASGYRLPTEAEWEYACRAGTTTPFNTGNNITTSQANYDGDKTTAAGSFAPNRWGLYDMHGNVVEWCWDWYSDYTSGTQKDPSGAVSGSSRVIHGGAWGTDGLSLRSAWRLGLLPSYRGGSFFGFRLVRNR
jgi:formylglycine-generating enzyme required for sulfatase activity